MVTVSVRVLETTRWRDSRVDKVQSWTRPGDRVTGVSPCIHAAGETRKLVHTVHASTRFRSWFRSVERFHQWGRIRSDTPPSIELGGESEFMLRCALRATLMLACLRVAERSFVSLQVWCMESMMLGASCVSGLSISVCACGPAMLGALLVMASCMRE